MKEIAVWTDYAGCLETRKSTSGGVIQLGFNSIKNWSSTQNVIALSSGEAEYYAMVKGGSQALGIRSMLKDLGIRRIRITLKADATAAKGIAGRRGLGQVRHIEVNQLWLQDKVSQGDIVIHKVKGTENLADALTKYVLAGDLNFHIENSGIREEYGRHELAPETESGSKNVESEDWDDEDAE